MAEQTVREQMAEALDNTLTGLIAIVNAVAWIGPPPPDYSRRVAEANNALDRHRAEPEGCDCEPGPRDIHLTDCPCYQEGLEAQREPPGGGTA